MLTVYCSSYLLVLESVKVVDNMNGGLGSDLGLKLAAQGNDPESQQPQHPMGPAPITRPAPPPAPSVMGKCISTTSQHLIQT